MSEFVLIGRIIAVDKQQSVASKSDPTKTFPRRQVYMDCSRYDSITGEQLSENKPLLEFGGKGLDMLNALCQQGLKQGDLVAVKFAIQGNSYKDKDGKTKNFTGIRPYAIERYIPKTQQQNQTAHTLNRQAQTQQSQVQQPAQTQQPVQEHDPVAEGLPF
jgi:hypothetical protein